MKWKSKLFAQSGFTLVEVLIAAAALGGLALVATQLSSDADKTKKHFEVSTEITQIKSAISTMLMGAAACRNTLQGLNVSGANTITEIRDGGNVVRYSSNPGSPQFKLYNNKINITSIRTLAPSPALTTLSTGKMGKIELEITFHKVNTISATDPKLKFFKGGQNVVEKIPIAITTNSSDVITSCFTDLLSAQQTICEKFGGSFDVNTANCTLSAYPGIGTPTTINTVDGNHANAAARERVVSEQYIALLLDDLDNRYVNSNAGNGPNRLTGTATTLVLGDNASSDIIGFMARLGVGTTAPEAALHVTGANAGNLSVAGVSLGVSGSYASVEAKGSAGGYVDFGPLSSDFSGRILYENSTNSMRFSTTMAERMIIDNVGNVAIGIASPGIYKLYVNGNGHYNGYVISTTGFEVSSDAKLKKNIKTVESPVEKILGLRGVTFLWDKDKYPDRNVDDRKVYGFVAQEVEKVVPELVRTDKEGYKSVQYQNITSILVEAFKDAWAKIKDMANKIADLDDKTDKLAKENSKLEKRIKELESNHRALAEENKAIKELVCSSADAKTKKLKICK